nr:M23 family metallopeptidase [Clostridia bacterium]
MKPNISERRRTLGLISVLIAGLIAVALMLTAVFNIGSDTPLEDEKQPQVTTASPKLNTAPDNDVLNEYEDIDDEAEVNARAEETKPAILDNSQKAAEVSGNANASAQTNKTPVSLTPKFTAPVDGVVSKTHDEDLLVYSVTMNDYRVHLGVDVAAQLGAPVYACADGVVEKVVEEPFMGYTVVIDHGHGYKSACKNLSDIIPEGIVEGASVKSGDLIGSVGDSALAEIADQPHLHFEIEKDSVKLDPLDFVEFDGAVDYSE